MDGATATGLFTLGGVIVGGVINGGVTYAIERRRDGWTAKKDARLFIPHLHRMWLAANDVLDRTRSWDALHEVLDENLPHWEQRYADVFAGTLTWDEWSTVYGAVRRYQQARDAPLGGAR
jgi:hypothetical protein